MEQSSPRITLAEGDITQNDHLVVELVDGQETRQVVLIHWPVKATVVRPAAYGDAAKAMRLLANADVELARLRTRRRPRVERVIDIRHPEVHIKLTGKDGNAFMIIGLVQRALRDAGISEEEVSQYHADVTSGGHDQSS